MLPVLVLDFNALILDCTALFYGMDDLVFLLHAAVWILSNASFLFHWHLFPAIVFASSLRQLFTERSGYKYFK